MLSAGRGLRYTVEELMAHILSHAVSNAANFAEQVCHRLRLHSAQSVRLALTHPNFFCRRSLGLS